MDLAAAATVGGALFAVLAPTLPGGDLDSAAVRAVRGAALCALGWALAAATTLLFTASDIIGAPLAQLDYGPTFAGLVVGTSQGRMLAAVVVVASLLALTAARARSTDAAIGVLMLALATTLPPVLTGHSATSGHHLIATASLLVHVWAVTLWVGGLFAVVAYGTRAPGLMRTITHRFSTLALWCFGATAATGVVNGLIRLGSWSQLWESRYGWLIIGKLLALTALGGFGWLHRRRTLTKLDDGRPGAFRRLAVSELAVMVATIGLAAALARTPPPPTPPPPDHHHAADIGHSTTGPPRELAADLVPVQVSRAQKPDVDRVVRGAASASAVAGPSRPDRRARHAGQVRT